MDGDFYVAASLATTLTKVALRYVAIVQDKKKQNVSCPSALLVLPRQHQQHKITNVTKSFFFSFSGDIPEPAAPPQSFVAESMLIMVTVLHLGKSSLPKKPITDDDVDRISLCLKVLSECSPLMNDIFNKECRKSLSHMLAVRLEEEKLSQKVKAVDSTPCDRWPQLMHPNKYWTRLWCRLDFALIFHCSKFSFVENFRSIIEMLMSRFFTMSRSSLCF